MLFGIYLAIGYRFYNIYIARKYCKINWICCNQACEITSPNRTEQSQSAEEDKSSYMFGFWSFMQW